MADEQQQIRVGGFSRRWPALVLVAGGRAAAGFAGGVADRSRSAAVICAASIAGGLGPAAQARTSPPPVVSALACATQGQWRPWQIAGTTRRTQQCCAAGDRRFFW
jgi:hypothetical protein